MSALMQDIGPVRPTATGFVCVLLAYPLVACESLAGLSDLTTEAGVAERPAREMAEGGGGSAGIDASANGSDAGVDPANAATDAAADVVVVVPDSCTQEAATTADGAFVAPEGADTES